MSALSLGGTDSLNDRRDCIACGYLTGMSSPQVLFTTKAADAHLVLDERKCKLVATQSVIAARC